MSSVFESIHSQGPEIQTLVIIIIATFLMLFIKRCVTYNELKHKISSPQYNTG